MSMAEQVKANINTILMCATLGLLGWVTVTTQNTSVTIAKMASSIESITKDQDRSEREMAELRARISALELKVVVLMPK